MSVRIMSLVFAAKFPEAIEYQTASGKVKRLKASTAKLVLLAYADHANDEGRAAYPSISHLAQKTGLTERAVKNAVRALVQAGFLVPAGKSHKNTNEYIISTSMLLRYIPKDEKGEPSSPLPAEGVNPVHPQGESSSPKPSLNRPVKRTTCVAEGNASASKKEKVPRKVLRDLVQVWAFIAGLIPDVKAKVPSAVYPRVAREVRRALEAKQARMEGGPTWEEVGEALRADLRAVWQGVKDWETSPSHMQIHERLAKIWAGTWKPGKAKATKPSRGPAPSKTPTFTDDDLKALGLVPDNQTKEVMP